MISMTLNDTKQNEQIELNLLDDKNRPTLTLIGLVALELAVYATIAYGTYKLSKVFEK